MCEEGDRRDNRWRRRDDFGEDGNFVTPGVVVWASVWRVRVQECGLWRGLRLKGDALGGGALGRRQVLTRLHEAISGMTGTCIEENYFFARAVSKRVVSCRSVTARKY